MCFATGNKVVGAVVYGDLRPGGPWVYYQPPPFDVRSAEGAPADPLDRFPVQEHG